MVSPDSADKKINVKKYLSVLATCALALASMWCLLVGGVTVLESPSLSSSSGVGYLCRIEPGVLTALYGAWIGTSGLLLLLSRFEQGLAQPLSFGLRVRLAAALFVAMSATSAWYYATSVKYSEWRLSDVAICHESVRDEGGCTF